MVDAVEIGHYPDKGREADGERLAQQDRLDDDAIV
jgi:hypothetical protein